MEKRVLILMAAVGIVAILPVSYAQKTTLGLIINLTGTGSGSGDNIQSWLFNGDYFSPNSTGNVNISTGTLIVTGLANCDTINTTENGTFVCGTDSSGGDNIQSWLCDSVVCFLNSTKLLNITKSNGNLATVGNLTLIGDSEAITQYADDKAWGFRSYLGQQTYWKLFHDRGENEFNLLELGGTSCLDIGNNSAANCTGQGSNARFTFNGTNAEIEGTNLVIHNLTITPQGQSGDPGTSCDTICNAMDGHPHEGYNWFCLDAITTAGAASTCTDTATERNCICSAL